MKCTVSQKHSSFIETFKFHRNIQVSHPYTPARHQWVTAKTRVRRVSERIVYLLQMFPHPTNQQATKSTRPEWQHAGCPKLSRTQDVRNQSESSQKVRRMSKIIQEITHGVCRMSEISRKVQCILLHVMGVGRMSEIKQEVGCQKVVRKQSESTQDVRNQSGNQSESTQDVGNQSESSQRVCRMSEISQKNSHRVCRMSEISRKVQCILLHGMGWLQLVGSLKLQVSFAKEPYTAQEASWMRAFDPAYTLQFYLYH